MSDLTSALPLLRLRGLHKSFGTLQVLKGIDLDVQPGSVMVLIGPSGSGKSTLIRMLNGLVQPDQGTVELSGKQLNTHSESAWQKLRLQVGMVFQDYTLFPHLSVLDNITLTPVRRKLCSRAEAEADARKLLAKVGLEHKADAWPSELSGGQQQRVALARALITDPEALLLDEPLSALDPFLKIRMRAELKKLQTSLGITFVHVTHSQEEAMALADIIVIMNDGRIEQAAHPRVVFEKPATAFVAKFMGDHNVISGRVTKSAGQELMLSVPAGADFLAVGDNGDLTDQADIAIRTDHVRIGQPSETGLGFTGSITNIEYRGSSVKLSVNGAGIEDFTAILSDTDFFANPVKVGEAIPLCWGREDAIVLGRLKH